MAGTRPGTPSRQKGLLQLRNRLWGGARDFESEFLRFSGGLTTHACARERDEGCGYIDFVSRRNGRNGAAWFAAPPVSVTFAAELSQDELD